MALRRPPIFLTVSREYCSTPARTLSPPASRPALASRISYLTSVAAFAPILPCLSPWMDARWHHAADRVRRRTPALIGLGVATMILTDSEAVRRQAYTVELHQKLGEAGLAEQRKDLMAASKASWSESSKSSAHASHRG